MLLLIIGIAQHGLLHITGFTDCTPHRMSKDSFEYIQEEIIYWIQFLIGRGGVTKIERK